MISCHEEASMSVSNDDRLCEGNMFIWSDDMSVIVIAGVAAGMVDYFYLSSDVDGSGVFNDSYKISMFKELIRSGSLVAIEDHRLLS